MGGTESVMMNYYRNFNRDELQVDFVVHGNGKSAYDEEVLNMGGKIFNVTPKGQNYKENAIQLKKIITEGKYSVVHAHMDAGNAQVLKIAKQCNVPIRISHSHNTGVQTTNFLKQVYNYFEKKHIPQVSTHLFACSDFAGKWLYGKNSFQVIKNAIDVDKFKFSADLRNQMRKELQIEDDAPVIGHIGRFSEQKNHIRIVSIFKELKKSLPNAKLLLIGNGPKYEEIETLISSNELQNSVIFVKQTNEISKYMQAMDVFLLPSKFEGFPVVSVEAQAAGLPTVLSDAITKEVAATDLVRFIPLDAADTVWCDGICEMLKKERNDKSEVMKNNGFDIVSNAKKMQDFYLSGEMHF